MSIEGGRWECNRHDFETDDIHKWDAHCYKYKKEHTLDVKQICPNCGTENKETIDYVKDYTFKAHSPTGSGILLECSKCFGGISRDELI